jgi:hypothetical protein
MARRPLLQRNKATSKILGNARIRQRKANILIFDECPEIHTVSMTVYGVMFCDSFPATKPQSMTPANPSKRLQPISESSTKPDPSPPQKRVKLGPNSPTQPDPAVIRLQRTGFLDSLSRPVTRPPEQSMQDDKEAPESSGSHLEDAKRHRMALLRIRPTSGHFTWTILHISGV